MRIDRDHELRRLDQLLVGVRAGRSGVLVIAGEGGTGKTTLLDAVVERAQEMEVLRTTGIAGEGEVAYAGLLGLLRPLISRIDRLAAPQAGALRAALGLEHGAGGDAYLVGAAVLSLLTMAAEDGPVLAVVDDVQWLDTASTRALFALHRLYADQVGAVIAVRTGEPLPTTLHRLDQDLETLRLPPLTEKQVATLLESYEVSTTVAAQLHKATGGNPLALVETVGQLSAAQRRGTEALPDHAIAPSSVVETYAERLRRLPVRTTSALLLVALCRFDHVGLLTMALRSRDLVLADLTPAEDAGLISLAPAGFDNMPRWRHPLVTSTVVSGAQPSQRRAAHVDLAEALNTMLQSADDGLGPSGSGPWQGAYRAARAWHRAAAAVVADEDVASDLEAAGVDASDRRAHAEAATAFRSAALLSTNVVGRGRRWLLAAQTAWRAGDADATGAILDAALAADPPGKLHVGFLRLRALREHAGGLSPGALDLYRQAVVLATQYARHVVAELAAEAVVAAFFAADGKATLEFAAHARRNADPADAQQVFHADYAEGVARTFTGDAASGRPAMLRALSALSAGLFDPHSYQFAFHAISGGLWINDTDFERQRVDGAISQLRAEGELSALPKLLKLRAMGDLHAGRWDDAWRDATETLELANITRQLNIAVDCMSVLAWIAALRGHEEACRSYVRQSQTVGRERGANWSLLTADYPLAWLALSLGRFDEAAERISTMLSVEANASHSNPAAAPAAELPDLVEALLGAGRAADATVHAAQYLALVESHTGLLPALTARVRGLVAPTNEEAFEAYELALAEHADTTNDFASARTKLVYGERLRRAGHRQAARLQLRAAAEVFEQYRAAPWAQRAHRELAATGLVRRSVEQVATEELTEQEQRVALLAADGLSNKQIAAQLFLSPKTVEFHLSRIYPKLGLRSRTQLARHLATRVP